MTAGKTHTTPCGSLPFCDSRVVVLLRHSFSNTETELPSPDSEDEANTSLLVECGFYVGGCEQGALSPHASKARPSLASKPQPAPTTSKARPPMADEARPLSASKARPHHTASE
eukprot:5574292-Pleurochrysis_carterae.AAC.1